MANPFMKGAPELPEWVNMGDAAAMPDFSQMAPAIDAIKARVNKPQQKAGAGGMDVLGKGGGMTSGKSSGMDGASL